MRECNSVFPATGVFMAKGLIQLSQGDLHGGYWSWPSDESAVNHEWCAVEIDVARSSNVCERFLRQCANVRQRPPFRLNQCPTLAPQFPNAKPTCLRTMNSSCVHWKLLTRSRTCKHQNTLSTNSAAPGSCVMPDVCQWKSDGLPGRMAELTLRLETFLIPICILTRALLTNKHYQAT